MFFYKKHGKKNKKNKGKNFTCNAYKSSSISKALVMSITNTVLSKQRLLVFTESM
jgi:hypothetical protein